MGSDPAPRRETDLPAGRIRVLVHEDEDDPWANLAQRLRAEMPDPANPNDRSGPPPGMTIGFRSGDYTSGLVSTRIFAIPNGSIVELAETREVRRARWAEEATKDAWAWYDKWAPRRS